MTYIILKNRHNYDYVTMYCLVRNKQVVRYFWRLAHRETLENGKWPDVAYEVPLNPARTQTKLVTSDVYPTRRLSLLLGTTHQSTQKYLT